MKKPEKTHTLLVTVRFDKACSLTEQQIESRVRRMQEHLSLALDSGQITPKTYDHALLDLDAWEEAKRLEIGAPMLVDDGTGTYRPGVILCVD